MIRLLLLAAAFPWAPAVAQSQSFESSLSDARRFVGDAAKELPRSVLRLPAAAVRVEQSKAFLQKTLGAEIIGISMGFSGESSALDDWGKFRIGSEVLEFSFSDLQKGVRERGFLFQSVYEDALILRVTRLSDGATAQADYMELLEMLFREGPRIRVGGIEFALFVEEGSPIPATISLIQNRSSAGQWAYRIYLRSGSRAGGRITWFFVKDGLEYGLRPEGGQVVFYAREGPSARFKSMIAVYEKNSNYRR
jgi:hypothetical protein